MSPFFILIPSYEPDERLLSYVNELKKCKLTHIIIVDDGSGQIYQPIFHTLAIDGCVVLHHPENLGKGSALKTGFSYILKNHSHYKEFSSVVMVDSDGQHAVEDVVRISNLSIENPHALTLGVRDFTSPGIPTKSLMGNKFASFMFASLYGIDLPDTQTGLRAFGIPLLSFMSTVKGNRFEYEIQMLIACVQAGIPMDMLSIQVIYENANEGTHFRPLRDSLKIMTSSLSNFARFLASSLASSLVDLGIAWFLLDFLRPFLPREYLRILVATVIARGISMGVNYLLNRHFVFQDKKADTQTLIRYLILSVLLIILSTTGVYGLYKATGINEKTGKLICDAVLFLLSYKVQQRWVFRKGDKNHDK